MNTPHNETRKKSQFRPLGTTFDEGEKHDQPPMTDNQNASYIQTPIHDEQSDSHIQTPLADSPSMPSMPLPVTGRQSVPPVPMRPPMQLPTKRKQSTSQFKVPVMRRQGTEQGTRQALPDSMPASTNEHRTSAFRLPIAGRQDVPLVPPLLSIPSSPRTPAYQPVYPPVTGQHSMPSLPSVAPTPVIPTATAPLSPLVTKKPRPVRVLLLMSILLVLMLGAGGLTTWMLQQHTSLPQTLNSQKNGSSVQSQVDATPALNSITNNKEISPLLFGTNMSLFSDAQEPILRSAKTQQLLKNIGVRLIRMPTRPTLSDATETAAAQAIKNIGAVPLVLIAGPGYPNGSILQTNQHTLALITRVFGNAPVYFEFGNESDLAGVTAQQYVTIWNQVVPVLKQQFPTARFIGPDNYQFTRAYLKTFLQQAKPLPDGVSWHEYTCSVTWAANFCMENIDAWNVHFAQARLVMQETIGKQLPIWVTEWNYASDTTGQLATDGLANNLAFMQAWTQKAMQTLIANRIFAAMQYFATDTPMPLIVNDQIGVEGQVFQQEYKQIMVDGVTPPMEVMTYPTPTKTVDPHDAFSFENGSTGGWDSFGPGISPTVNSTTEAFDGTHSLEFTLTDASESDYPYIAVDANQLPMVPKAGQLLTAYIYVANKAALVNAKIFVANAQHNWLFGNSLTLTPGQWNKVWFGLPVNFTNQVSQVGIQFFTATPGVSSIVYVDAIGWQ